MATTWGVIATFFANRYVSKQVDRGMRELARWIARKEADFERNRELAEVVFEVRLRELNQIPDEIIRVVHASYAWLTCPRVARRIGDAVRPEFLNALAGAGLLVSCYHLAATGWPIETKAIALVAIFVVTLALRLVATTIELLDESPWRLFALAAA